MLQDSHCLSIIIAAKELKTKAGKYKMSDLNRSLLDRFISFDVNRDWMESTDFTKLNKVLASAVMLGSELNYCPLGMKSSVAKEVTKETYQLVPNMHTYSHKIGAIITDSIFQLSIERQHYALDIKTVFAEEDMEWIQMMISRVLALKPIHEKFMVMSKRLMRNGKLPKEETEKRKQAMIKGMLNKDLARELTIVKNDWIKIIYDYTLDDLKHKAKDYADFINDINAKITEARGNYCATKDEVDVLKMLRYNNILANNDKLTYKISTVIEFEKISKRISENEGEQFYFKLADKLGGLIADNNKLISLKTVKNGKTPFISKMDFVFEHASFTVVNKIVVNRSPLNNYFYQYPCTFHDCKIKGKELKGVSEVIIKQAFIKIK